MFEHENIWCNGLERTNLVIEMNTGTTVESECNRIACMVTVTVMDVEVSN